MVITLKVNHSDSTPGLLGRPCPPSIWIQFSANQPFLHLQALWLHIPYEGNKLSSLVFCDVAFVCSTITMTSARLTVACWGCSHMDYFSFPRPVLPQGCHPATPVSTLIPGYPFGPGLGVGSTLHLSIFPTHILSFSFSRPKCWAPINSLLNKYLPSTCYTLSPIMACSTQSCLSLCLCPHWQQAT